MLFRSARTPFLDHLAQISKIYSDTTAVSNHEYSAIASLITGKLPRDHGYYRDFSASHELPPIITENLKDTSYLSHAFIYTSNQLVFTKLQGFRRIYLSRPNTHSIQTPGTQLNNLMNSPQMIANPGFFWVHLAPELYSEFDSIEPFHLSAYHQKPVPISSIFFSAFRRHHGYQSVLFRNRQVEIRDRNRFLVIEIGRASCRERV